MERLGEKAPPHRLFDRLFRLEQKSLTSLWVLGYEEGIGWVCVCGGGWDRGGGMVPPPSRGLARGPRSHRSPLPSLSYNSRYCSSTRPCLFLPKQGLLCPPPPPPHPLAQPGNLDASPPTQHPGLMSPVFFKFPIHTRNGYTSANVWEVCDSQT